MALRPHRNLINQGVTPTTFDTEAKTDDHIPLDRNRLGRVHNANKSQVSLSKQLAKGLFGFSGKKPKMVLFTKSLTQTNQTCRIARICNPYRHVGIAGHYGFPNTSDSPPFIFQG